MSHVQYIPIPQPEDDEIIVRRCLRKLAKQMQERGEIPPDVSEAELYTELEKHVPHFLKTVRSSPLYAHYKEAGHTKEEMKEHINSIIRQRF